jgi:hypothetical protein
MYKHGDHVEFRVQEGSSTWMKGTIYAVLRNGPIVIIVGGDFYDVEPRNVRKVSSDAQV